MDSKAPKVSVPLASNIGTAPAKVTGSQTLSFGGDGSVASAATLQVSKADIRALGKPREVVTAAPGAVSSNSAKVVLTFATNIKDGDTVDFATPGGKALPEGTVPNKAGGFTCRIEGINAPETGKGWKVGDKGDQQHAQESLRYLEKLIASKQVNVTVTGDAKYGRNLCQLEVHGKDVSLEMLRVGAAMMYRRYVQPGNPHYAEYDAAEKSARENHRGIFGYSTPPIDPERYNHSN